MPTALPTSSRLDLERILEAAQDIIRADGFEALSMRKLAQRLGVGAMTLYGYVQTKDELLTLLAEQLMGRMKFGRADRDWQDQLKDILRSVHRLFVEHPELAEIVARQHLNAVSAFRGAEIAFAALHRAGLDAEDSMSAFLALVAYTAGFAQREQHRSRDPQQHERRVARLKSLPAGEFQHVSRLTELFVSGPDARHFEDGLDLLVRGIASKAQDSNHGRTRARQTRR